MTGPSLPELLAFGAELTRRVSGIAPEPIAYGSLAYLVHTGDRRFGLNDIDFLVPEATFPGLIATLASDPSLIIEETTYHSLKVRRGELKVSFDGVEAYLSGIDHQPAPAELEGFRFLVIDREALRASYERAAETIPKKRDAYRLKLRGLDRKS